MKRVLMVAYHFPPLQGSSGIQRTLRFVRHLPKFGWEPLVLSAHPRAYDAVSDDQLKEVDPRIVVRRAFALNASRHLSIKGRYPDILSRPDRFTSWWLGAVPAGLEMIRKYRPDVIWSTFPVPTAHAIGHTLARLSGLPWIADFRDPMAQADYPEEPRMWRSYDRLEKRVVQRASACVFTTPSAQQEYQERYPFQAERMLLIENGYDAETFDRVTPAAKQTERFVLLHSGIIYPSERDPTALFDALALLKADNRLNERRFVLRLRASQYDDALRAAAKQRGLDDWVDIVPAIPYGDALSEMLSADGLLVLQAKNCNAQVPAKLYEYLRSGRPILALTDSAGDTAKVLRSANAGSVAPLDNAPAIADALVAFIDRVENGQEPAPSPSVVQACSREARTAELARLFDRWCSQPQTSGLQPEPLTPAS